MEKPTTRVASHAQASRKDDENPGATETPEPELIYIRVRKAVVLPTQTPISTTSPANPPLTTGHLYLVEGSLYNIKRYAGGTVDWVIKVAQLICDPLRAGRLYTHTTETSSHWYTLDRTSEWRQVLLGDPLQPGIYEFEPVGPICLSQISERNNHSKTTAGSKLSSVKFHSDVVTRDGTCVVTQTEPFICNASHLIPKRMGTDGAQAVVERFSGTQDAPGIHKFDPRIGTLLISTLDKLVDSFWVGFYHTTGNSYILHNFYSNPNISIYGMGNNALHAAALPRLHLYPVTLTTHNSTALPPPGTFDWHYLQCVLGVFAAQDYKDYPGIKYYVHPFKNSDSDDEWDDEYFDDHPEIEPPYPSYRFDRHVAAQWEKQRALERNQEVAHWASGI